MSEGNGKLRLRNLYDFWAEDKALLLASSPSFELAWANSVPDKDDLEALAGAYISSHSDDSAAFVLSENALRDVVAQLSHEVSSLWQEKLTEIPQISILSSVDYHPEFNRLNKELCAHLGIDVDDAQEPLFPPSVVLFPHVGRLLVSDVCSLSLRSADSYLVSPAPWKQKHLEYSLAQALATSLYAQIRGDWKDPTSISLNSLSPGSKYILPALLVYTTEALARASHPDWALQVVHEHVFDVYCNTDALRTYRLVDAYLRSFVKSPAQLAMVSDFICQTDKGILEVVFMPEHPFHDMRVQYFKEGRVGFS